MFLKVAASFENRSSFQYITPNVGKLRYFGINYGLKQATSKFMITEQQFIFFLLYTKASTLNHSDY